MLKVEVNSINTLGGIKRADTERFDCDSKTQRKLLRSRHDRLKPANTLEDRDRSDNT